MFVIRERQQADAQREAQREAKFGRSTHSRFFEGGSASERRGGRRRTRDFLGYYRLLGVAVDGT